MEDALRLCRDGRATFEINHAESFQASDADRIRFEYRTLKGGLKEQFPLRQRPSVLSTVPLRHLARKKRLLWQYQFQNVNVAIGGKETGEMLQQIANGVVGKMMKKAVYENEVITLGRAHAVPGYIGYYKVSSKPALCLPNVRGIDIHTGVINAGEQSSVSTRSAAYVKHAADRAQIIMGQHGK